jgi:hypothetical protein
MPKNSEVIEFLVFRSIFRLHGSFPYNGHLSVHVTGCKLELKICSKIGVREGKLKLLLLLPDGIPAVLEKNSNFPAVSEAIQWDPKHG